MILTDGVTIAVSRIQYWWEVRFRFVSVFFGVLDGKRVLNRPQHEVLLGLWYI